MRLRTQIWTFLRLVYAEWSSLVTGSFSAGLFLLGLGISIASAFGVTIPSEAIIQTATWTLAGICGGRAAFSVWEREHQARLRAEEKLTPKIIAVYDPSKPPCRSVSTFNYGPNSLDGMVYRVEVENIGEETVTNCEGYLVEVAFEEEVAELGPMSLVWSGIYPQPLRIDLRKGIKRQLDLLVIYQNNQISILSPSWPPNNRQDFFSRPGHYRFAVVISGEGTGTLPSYKLRLSFTGDWQTSTMETTVG
jgi:hypothetical protein